MSLAGQREIYGEMGTPKESKDNAALSVFDPPRVKALEAGGASSD